MDDDTQRTCRGTVRRTIVILGSCLLLFGCNLPRVHLLSDPLTAEEHLNLGVAYEQERRYEEARREYRKALDAGMPLARVYLGNAAYLTGDYEAAERWYRKALDEDPTNAALCNNLAWLYYKQGARLGEAVALAEKAVDLEPESGAYRHTLETLKNHSPAPTNPE